MDSTEEDDQKKSKSFLVRVEEDVYAFYKAEAKKRRISVAIIVRELLYRDMAEKLSKEAGNGQL